MLIYPIIFGLCLFLTPAQARNLSEDFISSDFYLKKSESNLPQQQQEVKGVIRDAKGVLPGVSISIKGKPISGITNENGEYTIAARVTDTLVFAFIGYKVVTLAVNGRSRIDVKLEEDLTALQEVVVNAGYYKVKESERTGSIARVTAKDIERQPVTNILATMQGRMAGVNINQTTGVSGGGFNIEIRGKNSLRANGNAPLYIVDGIPSFSENLGNIRLSGSVLPGEGISPLSGINPTDIESIEILKDADATSIYGSRGANGVVLITTKKGKAGKTKFTLNAYTGTAQVTRTVDLMNTAQYLEMRREAFANDGVDIPSWANDVNGTWDQNRYTDWQKELIGGTAISSSIDAGVSGGNNSTQFIIRGTHYRETTVFPGDFSDNKSSLLFNINHKSEDNRFTVNMSGNYVIDKNNLLGTDLTPQSATLAPNAPALYDENGNLNWEHSTWANPLRLLLEKYSARTNNLTMTGIIGYKILPNLEFNTNVGFTDMRLSESKISPSTIYDPAYGLTSSASVSYLNNSKQQSWNIEPQLSWQHDIGRGNIKALIGTTFQERTSDRLGLSGTGFSSNSLINNLAAASRITLLNDNNIIYRYNAIFGRINYSYNEKYIVNLTGRRDGSSRFGPGRRFSNFAALGAAWLFHKENFVNKGLPFLSFGKLRSSYGTTGSDQIGDYEFLNTYAPSGAPYQGVIGLSPLRLYNPDFSWETNKKLEAALDLGFMNDRIFFTTAYYRNRSSSQLVGIPLPGTTGFPSIQSNLNATVQNTGWEFELRTVNFQNTNFRWSTSLNLTFARNKLIEFPNLEGSTYADQYIIGQSTSINRLYHFTGVNPETGIYEFEDYNGDGMLSNPEDRQKIVNLSPDYFGGLQNSLSYKNWELDFLFQFVKQEGFNYNYTAAAPGAGGNQSVYFLDRWQQPGDINPIQQYTAGFNDAALTASSRFSNSDAAISDASFIRLKNLSLAYTLPNHWMKTAGCRIYLQAQNLLTITNYKGPDPENQSFGRLPPLRVISMGIQLNL